MAVKSSNFDPLNSKSIDHNEEHQNSSSETESDEPLFDNDNDASVEKNKPLNSSEVDLFVSVADPIKQVHSMETFISYKVTTNTTRSTYDSTQYEVQRRYQDFVRLREKIEEEFPTFVIAPLPAKFVVKGMLDRFSHEFTETRCIALNNFLQRLVNHPLVSFSDHLKSFLTSEHYTVAGKPGLLARMSGSLKWSSIANPEYDEIGEAATMFGEKLGVVDRINERILSEKKEYLNEMKEFIPTFSSWGEVEKEPIETVMESVKDSLSLCMDEMNENIGISERKVIPTIKEYLLYVENIKQVLKRRNDFQYRFEKVDEELKARKNEKENLSKSDQSRSFMGRTAEQKEEKLVEQIKDLTNQREKLNDDLTKANTNFQADYDRWKQQKLKDNLCMMSTFASAQVAYHDNCLGAWETILPSLQSSANKDKSSPSS